MTIKKLIENLRSNYNPGDHIAAQVWCAGDVLEKAHENNISLTREQANKIIDNLNDDIDPEIGINRDLIQTYIDNYLANNKLVVVVQAGIVTNVFSEESNLKVVVIDLDAKKTGSEDFVTEMKWPDTQYDKERIKDLLASKKNEKETPIKKEVHVSLLD